MKLENSQFVKNYKTNQGRNNNNESLSNTSFNQESKINSKQSTTLNSNFNEKMNKTISNQQYHEKNDPQDNKRVKFNSNNENYNFVSSKIYSRLVER